MFEGYEELNTQDVERMQEVIRTLLAQTFLPERKYDKKYGRMMPDRMYDFSDRHLEFLTEYFAVAGIKLCQDTELGIIYLEGTDGIGEKLSKLATIYLLLLKLIYDEKMAAVSSSVNVITTFGELNGKAGEFRLIKGPSSMNLSFILELLYQLQLAVVTLAPVTERHSQTGKTAINKRRNTDVPARLAITAVARQHDHVAFITERHSPLHRYGVHDTAIEHRHAVYDDNRTDVRQTA